MNQKKKHGASHITGPTTVRVPRRVEATSTRANAASNARGEKVEEIWEHQGDMGIRRYSLPAAVDETGFVSPSRARNRQRLSNLREQGADKFENRRTPAAREFSERVNREADVQRAVRKNRGG